MHDWIMCVIDYSCYILLAGPFRCKHIGCHIMYLLRPQQHAMQRSTVASLSSSYVMSFYHDT